MRKPILRIIALISLIIFTLAVILYSLSGFGY